MRTPYYEFKEYHTADDDLKLVKKKILNDSLVVLSEIVTNIENKKFTKKSKNKKKSRLKPNTYLNLKPYCEPQLGKRKLYREISKQRLVDKNDPDNLREISIFWILNFSDGMHSLKDISKKSGIPIQLLKNSAEILLKKKLLKKLK